MSDQKRTIKQSKRPTEPAISAPSYVPIPHQDTNILNIKRPFLELYVGHDNNVTCIIWARENVYNGSCANATWITFKDLLNKATKQNGFNIPSSKRVSLNFEWFEIKKQSPSSIEKIEPVKQGDIKLTKFTFMFKCTTSIGYIDCNIIYHALVSSCGDKDKLQIMFESTLKSVKRRNYQFVKRAVTPLLNSMYLTMDDFDSICNITKRPYSTLIPIRGSFYCLNYNGWKYPVGAKVNSFDMCLKKKTSHPKNPNEAVDHPEPMENMKRKAEPNETTPLKQCKTENS